MKIDEVCDYIIYKCNNKKIYISSIKLQILLYYCQAWYLVFYNSPMFVGKFEAHIAGVVNNKIYKKFIDRSLYDEITKNDISLKFSIKSLNKNKKNLINDVITSYGKYSGTQLEYLVKSEIPWVQARKGLSERDKTKKLIDEEIMRNYYKSRISNIE